MVDRKLLVVGWIVRTSYADYNDQSKQKCTYVQTFFDSKARMIIIMLHPTFVGWEWVFVSFVRLGWPMSELL